ncbi:MAG: glutathione S-transferase family protein [Geminicoccaceae bacterium]
MDNKPVLYGYSPSTYVRTARIVLALNDVDYDQVDVDVLGGETRLPEHLDRHPFGKVPVLDIDGMRLRETSVICRYLDETRDGPSCFPDDAKQRAKVNEAIGLYDHHGYRAMLEIAGYHLFPDFVGGQNDALREKALETAGTFFSMVMDDRYAFIAADRPNLADFIVAPVMFYVSMTPDADRVLALPGVRRWWDAINEVQVYKASEPVLG